MIPLRSYLRIAGAVIGPWAMVTLPMAAGDLDRVLLSFGPGLLAAIALNPSTFLAHAAITYGSTLLLILGLTWISRGSDKALAPIAAGSFLLAAGLALVIRQ